MTGDSSTPPQTLTGRCMCGAVSYKISAQPVAVGLCHCDRCRPQAGSAFSTVMFVQRDAFEINGETAVFEDVGASGMQALRRYCPQCGSPLMTEADVTPTLFFVKAGGLDQTDWLRPTFEMFVSRRMPWVSALPGAAQFDGNPTL
ncbi:hypothetical protein P3T21_006839 [Paraburkholderia sp. GAS334]